MSVLNYTAGTPGRVFGLLRLVNRLGRNSATSREQIVAWMAPEGVHTRDGSEKPRPKEGIDHTCSFAYDIGLLGGPPDGPWDVSTDWTEISQLADAVHHKLAGLPIEDENTIVLAAYAILLMHADREQHFGWGVRSQSEVVNEINDQIMKWRGRRIENLLSDEKFRTWEDWVAMMGLVTPEATLLSYAPYPLPRMRREVCALMRNHGAKTRLPAKRFWQELTVRMPYLDDGVLWNSIRPILGVPPFASTLSYVSSVALRQLADERLIDLELIADAQMGLRLKGYDQVVSAVTLLVGTGR